MNIVADPVLTQFCKEMDDLYQDRLHKIVLFGSRARGDGTDDSDYDLAVFLSEMDPIELEVSRISDVETAILYDTGKVINGLPLNATRWNDSSLFMQELRRDGIEL